MDSRWARVGRGTIAAAIATFVAAFSHALGGDAAPSWFGVGASFVLSLAVCTALSGRSLSWWRLAASVAVSQVLFHVLFSGPGATAASGHAHDAASVAANAMPAMDAHDDRMILAHVIAGIITLLALRFGERAFWSVADSARLVLARVLRVSLPVAATPGRAIPSVSRAVAAPRRIHVPSTHRHRGPPLQLVSI
jgi:hypothetical protein